MTVLPPRDALEDRVQSARNKVRVRPAPGLVEPTEIGRESVWRYPRPPRVEQIVSLIEVMIDGRTVARSERPLRVIETSSPPVIYFPECDLIDVRLIETGEWALCEWKGVSAFFDLQYDGTVVTKAGWRFHDPFDDLAQGYERLVAHIALFPARFGCYIDGVRAEPQSGGYYGGWITPNVRGPFKGPDGTENW